MKHFCQQASRLISDACERDLRPTERLRLRLHLLMCGMCRRYERSIRLMQAVLARMQAGAPELEVRLKDADRQQILMALRAIAEDAGNSPADS